MGWNRGGCVALQNEENMLPGVKMQTTKTGKGMRN
jgi:hypothetical protein